MGKKTSYVNFNSGGETIKIEIRDNTYKVMYRGTYKTNNKKDVYNMLTMLEKFTPFTINQIINWKNDWLSLRVFMEKDVEKKNND